jgi:hypothetical protein
MPVSSLPLFLRIHRQLVQLDRARQENREGLTAIRKEERAAAARDAGRHASTSSPSPVSVLEEKEVKVWLMRPGGVMLRMPSTAAKGLLEAEQARVEEGMAERRRDQKRLVAALADRGIQPEAVGPGLLNAFLTLEDKGSKKPAEAPAFTKV